MARRRNYGVYDNNYERMEEPVDETPIYEEDPDDSPVEEEKMEPKTRTGTIIGTRLLRVRDRPSMKKSEVVAVLQEGDQVKILDNAESRFYKIEVDEDTEGYIASKFCKENK